MYFAFGFLFNICSIKKLVKDKYHPIPSININYDEFELYFESHSQLNLCQRMFHGLFYISLPCTITT